jgi:hypothetical protein
LISWWSSAACIPGVGEPCALGSDCADGLACTAGACAACGAETACLPIDLVTASCDPAASPLRGVEWLRITVRGADFEPIVHSARVSDGAAQLPGIPFGTGRRVEVEGLAALEAPPLSRATSLPLDLLAGRPIPAATLWLRRVDSFTPVHPRGGGETCTRLAEARAGHTATLLADGRLLLAGGWTLDDRAARVVRASAELFDPRTGASTLLHMPMTTPRARHTATRLPDGRVLLAGGISADAAPLATAELYDPATFRFTPVALLRPRARHTATLLADGRVLLAGGAGDATDALDTTELFDPTADSATRAGPSLAIARRDHAAATLADGSVLLVGGHDGQRALAATERLQPAPDGALLAEAGPALAGARAAPAIVAFSSGRAGGLLVAGADAASSSLPAWELVRGPTDVELPTLSSLLPPLPREGACAAAFPGGLLIAAGRTPWGELPAVVDVFRIDGAGTLAHARARRDLASGRVAAACTALEDGTVLITGGEGDLLGRPTVSFEAEVYQP